MKGKNTKEQQCAQLIYTPHKNRGRFEGDGRRKWKGKRGREEERERGSEGGVDTFSRGPIMIDWTPLVTKVYRRS